MQGLRGGSGECPAAGASARRPRTLERAFPRHVRSGVPQWGSAGGGAQTPPHRHFTQETRSPVSDQVENLKPEEVSIGDRPLSIPSELPILPLRDTVLFPNSFMPLAVA